MSTKHKNIYLKLLLGILSVFQLYILLDYGIGLSEDAVSYKYAAKSLLEQGLFLNIDGSPFAHWPPLMPLLISALLLFSEKLLFLIPLGSFVLYAWAVFIWVKNLKIEFPFQLLGVLLFTLHFAVIYTAPMLWSDLLFLALLLFWLNALRSKNAFLAIALFAIMGLLRYAALFFLPVFVYYLFQKYQQNRKLKSLVIESSMGIAPILIWLIYTKLQSGFISGERIFPSEFYMEHFRSAVLELGRWILPSAALFPMHLLAAIAVLVLPIWLARKFPYVILAHLSYAAGFFLSYFLFDMQNPDARLLLPLLPAFLFSIILFLKKAVQEKRKLQILLLLAICSYSILRGGKLLVDEFRGDYGKYNLLHWQAIKNQVICNKLAEYDHTNLISNDAHGAHFLCNEEVMIWPKDRHFSKENLPEQAIFIWFRNNDPYQLYTSTAILSVYKTDTLQINQGWIIMKLESHDLH